MASLEKTIKELVPYFTASDITDIAAAYVAVNDTSGTAATKGMTLADQREAVATYKNAVKIGVVQGTGLAAGVVTNNTTLLQAEATAGNSIYFPPGQYEIDGAIAWASESNIKVWGDGAEIFQKTDGVRMFSFTSIDKLEVCGLTLHTDFFITRSSSHDGSTTSPIYVTGSDAVNIHHNTVEGFQCQAIRVNASLDITITNNIFLDGHWVPGQTEVYCIYAGWDGSSVRCRDLIIAHNQCNTMQLSGISSLNATRKTIVAFNSIIARENDGTPITAYQADAPKSGITIQYNADPPDYVGADNEDYDQMLIIGNNIQGCRFSGIDGQSSVRASSVHPGIRGVIAHNTIRYCGFETGAITSLLAAGINWIGYRDLIITGNIITNIDDTPANDVHALVLHNLWPRVDGSTGLGSPTSCHITDNIISNCTAHGIWIENECGDINITGNTLQDIQENELLRVLTPAGTYRMGHVIVNGNKFATTGNFGTTNLYGVRLEIGTTEPSEVTVCNNVFNFQDATFVNARPILALVTKQMVIANNRITGDGVNAMGMDLQSTTSSQRFDQAIIIGNQIDNCNIGVGSSTSATYGPWLLSCCSITNCTTDIEYPRSTFHGHWTSDGKAIMENHVDPTVTAPQGTYLTGDYIHNNGMTLATSPLGWFYNGTNWLTKGSVA